MSDRQSYHNRQERFSAKIHSLLLSLCNEPSNYDLIAPKIEYWIEYVLREQSITVDELVEGVSHVAWGGGGSYAVFGRFFKELRDAPRCSKQARTFVTRLCDHVLRRFAAASVEGLRLDWGEHFLSVWKYGGRGFVRAASFVGHLINSGLLSHELVLRHLPKPLTNHYDPPNTDKKSPAVVRASAIYQLFTDAGNTLLQGLLKPNDVQACFEILNAEAQWIEGFNAAKLQEFRDVHAAWMQQREEKENSGSRETETRQGDGEEDPIAAEAFAEVKTPVALVSQDLPAATINIELPSSIFQDIGSTVSDEADSSLETFINAPASAVSSPTLSISSVSDLTPTELGDDIEHTQEDGTTRHDTFYFGDGNVEIVCGNTIFRVHSTIVSFSSPKLRDRLSQSVLVRAPSPEGCPRITTSDSAEDFVILLKMIYIPGFPARHEVPEFTVFASLLRMTTKYGFSNVRDQLVKDIEDAYPTKWEAFQSADVLGEDIFGSPKPHPNAVLNLLKEQGLKFAIPFAAYRASIGGFSALMSDKLGTVLPRHTLATTIHGMHVLRSTASHSVRVVAYGGELWVCPDKGCVLNVGMDPVKTKMEAMGKIYRAMMEKREGGELSAPSLGDLLCAKCSKSVEGAHAIWASNCWKMLTQVFGVSESWDDL